LELERIIQNGKQYDMKKQKAIVAMKADFPIWIVTLPGMSFMSDKIFVDTNESFAQPLFASFRA